MARFGSRAVVLGLAAVAASSAQTDSGAQTLRGRIEDPEGAGVPGVAVVLYRHDARIAAGVQRPETRHVVSGAGGRFEVEAPAPGPYGVRLEAEGFARRQFVFDLTISPDEDLVWRIGEGATLHGRVEDPTGAPLAGIPLLFDSPGASLGSLGRTRTGPDGTFIMRGLEPGTRVRVRPYDTSPWFGSLEVDLSTDAGDVRLVLQSGTTAKVTVRDATGQPISGALVGLASTDRAATSALRSGSSGDDGRIQLASLAPGPYQLRVRAEGWAEEVIDGVVVEAGAPNDLDVVLRRGAVIRGRVRGLPEEESGPVRVVASERLPGKPAARRFVYGTVEAGGRYEIHHVGFRQGFVQASRADQSVSVEFTLDEAGDDLVLDLAFPSIEGLTIRGRVTLDGAPWGGVNVRASSRLVVEHARTAHDGTYVLRGLRSQTYDLAVFALRPRERDLPVVRSIAVEGDERVDWDLTSRVVSGRVFDPTTGEPIAGVEVELQDDARALSFDARVRRRTDAIGHFEFLLLAPVPVSLRFAAPGFAATLVELGEILEPRRAVELALAPTPPLEIVPQLEDGSTVGHLFVAYLGLRGQHVWSESSPAEDGTFRLHSAPSEGSLLVQARGTAAVAMPLPPPARRLEIPLPTGGSVSVGRPAWLWPDGNESVTVRLLGPDGEPFRAPRLESGRKLLSAFAEADSSDFAGIPVGTWIVEVERDSELVWQSTVQVRAGQHLFVAPE